MGSNLDIGAIRTALAKQLRDALSDYVSVFPYRRPSMPLPALVVEPGGSEGDLYVNYTVTSGNAGSVDMWLTLELQVAHTEGDSAARLIDRFLSLGNPESILDAVHSDRTLGGVVEDCVILVGTTPEMYSPGEAAVTWRTSLPVQIITRKVPT
jgi:hypothetical protein